MRFKLIVGAIVLSLAGALTWAIIAQNKWEHRCHAAHGRVEQRFEGYITTYQYTYDDKGNIVGMIPQQTPNYSYHCWVGASEVSV